jgi:hypothetical protein
LLLKRVLECCTLSVVDVGTGPLGCGDRYIQNWSIWLDLKILIRTLSVVAGGTGS